MRVTRPGLQLKGSTSKGHVGSPFNMWAFTLLCAAVLFVFADQNLMAPNLTAIARDFG